MELPNYSRQLMQQLRTLRKERQFCDCTILVGNTPHSAHKLVLAASSLLFRSLLEGSDSISIDEAVVSSQEFSCLLDMVYTGRLPPGKHNFSRIIAAADSLQMFDVAVGCKNILTSLLKQSSVSTEHAPHLHESIEPQDTTGDSVIADTCQGEGLFEGQQEINTSQLGAQDVKNDAAEKATNLENQDVPSRQKEIERNNEGSSQHADVVELLSQQKDEITETLQKGQTWMTLLQTWDQFPSGERQVLLDCFKGNPGGDVVFQRLLDCVQNDRGLSAQTLLLLLDLFKQLNPPLTAQLKAQGEDRDVKHKDSSVPDITSSSGLMDQASKLTDCLATVNEVRELLTQAANNCQNEGEKEVVLECCQSTDPRSVMECLFDRVRQGSLSETGLLLLLHQLKKSCPDLSPLLEGLNHTGGDAKEDHSGESLLRMYCTRFSEVNVDAQSLRQSLESLADIPTKEREYMQALLENDDGAQGIERLICASLEESAVQILSVWRLLIRASTRDQDLLLLIQEIKKEPGFLKLLQTAAYADLLLKHKALILDSVSDINILERAVECMDKDSEKVTEFLQSCRKPEGEREPVSHIMDRVLSRDSDYVTPLCQLLSMNQPYLPQLQPFTEDLTQADAELERQPQFVSEPEAADSVEENDTKVKGTRGGPRSYACQWCNKSFDFKCRLLMHKKRCCLSTEVKQKCSECSKEFPTPRALQEHVSQDHSGPARKKRKQAPVACDLCDKTFAHSSGMLYHKRTEHFEERPYACEECGATFAANSSLKNHMRLHTGEKPFRCKHCDMSFSVAAALSYHTKKKHSEGKMYACQYCEAVFAQSIELTRHVRTHTGDKPYVCRECGKGFSQANGLSVHLQTYHNIAEPHDCQKCQMSFSSLEEHRRHIQEVHPKELHQCSECNKLLSTQSQLEKHKAVHAGGKPHSCKICHKSYQQLSGLWYHNRTTHPEVFTGQGSRPLRPVLQCKTCSKAFTSKVNLLKHRKSKHPEIHPDVDELDAQGTERASDVTVWKCLYCSSSLQSEEELQQHVSVEHFSQDTAVFGCTVCSLTFPTQLELQEHFLSNHLAALDEESQASTSQMVIQTEDSLGKGTEQIIALDQSQLDGSQRVFVALGDGEGASSGSGIVAVNMEDLLNGTVTLICEERR
ncbi:zinc finger and BTB domain-containing protein 40 [Chanos chanos]|uniref:Zinc finger and BTB domain-containing protein 40 n=1 Tax=Chanos chanos TaxID=29144 RepID=A0A6J2VJQ7_CHACN|nr:zinc finger and BTB domain-containing protein 40 [Chanos chanos]